MSYDDDIDDDVCCGDGFCDECYEPEHDEPFNEAAPEAEPRFDGCTCYWAQFAFDPATQWNSRCPVHGIETTP